LKLSRYALHHDREVLKEGKVGRKQNFYTAGTLFIFIIIIIVIIIIIIILQFPIT
jgi:hypothetical protein